LLANALSVLNYQHCPKIPLCTLYLAVIVVVRALVSVLGTLRRRGQGASNKLSNSMGKLTFLLAKVLLHLT
jgi:hypothetical protein